MTHGQRTIRAGFRLDDELLASYDGQDAADIRRAIVVLERLRLERPQDGLRLDGFIRTAMGDLEALDGDE